MTATSPGEIAALGAVGIAAVLAIVRATRASAFVRGVLLTALVLVTAIASAALRSQPRAAAPPPGAPRTGTSLGYASSSACLGCHPGEHESFRRSFHRTMTQLASTTTVHAPLGAPIHVDGVTLFARGEEVWATLPDPDASIAGRPAPEVTRRVVLTTGSHREQAYWVAGERRGDLRLVPVVWFVKDRAMVPRREAFLLPPDAPMPPVRWGSSCIACHAVAGEPRHDLETDSFDTRAAELGVSCEACHGPGAAHVERHRDPVARYAQHASKKADPTIVHPGRLDPERSAAVCGQCHAYSFPRDEAAFWAHGYARSFRPGDPLAPSRFVLTPRTLAGEPGGPIIDAPASAIFWPDGTVRVGGREYNGLVASPCFERGMGERKMTCLSCHAMHSGDPAGQIAPARAGDRGCTSCHTMPSGHAHHAAGSPGAACVSCHMARTSFALLSSVRSHRIESPNVASTLATGRPNACNLCHLDRSLGWTARWLADWYGTKPPVIPDDRARTSVALHDGLAGDAGVRALIADALGSADAIAASGSDFQEALLEPMRRDPYAAVRRIAERSTRSLHAAGSGYAARRSPAELDALGLDPSGRLDPERVRALLAARDQRPIVIAE